jgi:hypothetical protein
MRITARERDLLCIRRAWTASERRVVRNCFIGRCLIAIEPIICASVFAFIAIALVVRKQELAIVLSPILGLSVVCFMIYAVVLMIPPTRALLQSFSPIYIVDGYVRYRSTDGSSEEESNGYIAVLDDERRMLCEWPSFGKFALQDSVRPALVEFTHFGGIHCIDGRSTGVLPERVPSLGVGVS